MNRGTTALARGSAGVEETGTATPVVAAAARERREACAPARR